MAQTAKPSNVAKRLAAIAEARELRDYPAIDALTAAPIEMDADVIRLVIAARVVAFEDQSLGALRELGSASEAFADRVLWEPSS